MKGNRKLIRSAANPCRLTALRYLERWKHFGVSIIRVVPRVQLSSLSGDEGFLCCEDNPTKFLEKELLLNEKFIRF